MNVKIFNSQTFELIFFLLILRNEGCLEEALFSVSSYPELGVSNLMMACRVSIV